MGREVAIRLLQNLIAGQLERRPSMLEWREVDALVQGNNLGGYLYRLKNEDYSVPDEIEQRWKDEYIISLAESLFAERVYKEVEGILCKAGILLMPIKGMVFRYLLYGDPAVRPAVDIDILVRPGDFEAAHNALLQNGYKRVIDDHNRPITIEKIFERAYQHPEQSSTGTLVEIHQGFSQWNRYRVGLNALWSRSVRPEILAQRTGIGNDISLPFGPNTLVMSPEDTLVHQFIHNNIHMYNVPVRSFIDAKLIIEKWRPNWGDVVKRSRKVAVCSGAYITLMICRRMFNVQIPNEVLEAVKPSFIKRKWFDLFISQEPVHVSNESGDRLSFFRYSWNKRIQQATVGLPLIDGLGRSAKFAISYLHTRITDLIAHLSSKH